MARKRHDPQAYDLEANASFGQILAAAQQYLEDSGDDECVIEHTKPGDAIEQSKNLCNFKSAWIVQTGDESYNKLSVTSITKEGDKPRHPPIVRIRFRPAPPTKVTFKSASGTATIPLENDDG